MEHEGENIDLCVNGREPWVINFAKKTDAAATSTDYCSYEDFLHKKCRNPKSVNESEICEGGVSSTLISKLYRSYFDLKNAESKSSESETTETSDSEKPESAEISTEENEGSAVYKPPETPISHQGPDANLVSIFVSLPWRVNTNLLT